MAHLQIRQRAIIVLLQLRSPSNPHISDPKRAQLPIVFAEIHDASNVIIHIFPVQESQAALTIGTHVHGNICCSPSKQVVKIMSHVNIVQNMTLLPMFLVRCYPTHHREGQCLQSVEQICDCIYNALECTMLSLFAGPV